MKHRTGLTLAFGALIALLALLPSGPAWAETTGPDSGGTAPAAATTNTATTSTSVCGTKSDETDPAAIKGVGDTAMGAVQGVVAQGAIAAMCLTLSTIDVGASPALTTNTQNSWFSAMYTMFRSMSFWVIVPLLLIATIHAVAKGSLYLLLKTWLVFLPVSVVGGVVAVGVVQLLLTMTDDFSKTFLNSISAATLNSFAGITNGFGVAGVVTKIPSMVIIFTAILMMISAIGVYIILVLREASVYLATAFIPLTLAFFVWPATAGYFKKLAEFLMAMIMSKLIMVAGISLAVAAIASQTGQIFDAGQSTAVTGGVVQAGVTAAGAGLGNENWFGWLSQTMTTVVMFVVVIFSPSLLVKMLANIGLTSSRSAVADHATRPNVGQHAIFAHRMVSVGQYAAGWARTERAISIKKANLAGTTQQDRALSVVGVERGVDGTYAIGNDAVAEYIDITLKDQLITMSRSDNANDIAAAHWAYKFGATHIGNHNSSGYRVLTKKLTETTSESVIIADVVHNSDQVQRRHHNVGRYGMDSQVLAEELKRQKDAGAKRIRVVLPYDSVVQDAGTGSANFLSQDQKRDAWLNLRAVRDFNAQNPGVVAGVVYTAQTTMQDTVRAGNSSEGVGSRYET